MQRLRRKYTERQSPAALCIVPCKISPVALARGSWARPAHPEIGGPTQEAEGAALMPGATTARPMRGARAGTRASFTFRQTRADLPGWTRTGTAAPDLCLMLAAPVLKINGRLEGAGKGLAEAQRLNATATAQVGYTPSFSLIFEPPDSLRTLSLQHYLRKNASHRATQRGICFGFLRALARPLIE